MGCLDYNLTWISISVGRMSEALRSQLFWRHQQAIAHIKSGNETRSLFVLYLSNEDNLLLLLFAIATILMVLIGDRILA